MSSKIDERVVELKFNTKQFEQGVKNTQRNLDDLNKSLQMDGASKGLEQVADSVGKIESKFSVLGAIGLTAIMSLTNSAIGYGQKIASALIDPLVEGGKKRAQNIEQAKFQFEGLGMNVKQSMDDALFAVKDTAFGLDEAAVAASQFGASGIASGDEMKSALRGIAGVAAMAGSSYTDMANVFTKVAGQGRVMGDDLNRLGTRGINAASTLADYFNKTGIAAGATEASVREMVTKGQVDFKTFAAAMSDAFGDQATKANQTYAGSLSNLKAALSRVGAMYYTPKMEQSRKLFIALTGVVDKFAEALEPAINGLMDLMAVKNDNLIAFLEGLDFTNFIEGVKLIGSAIATMAKNIDGYIRPIQLAFADVFGGKQVTIFTTLGNALLKFAEALKPTYTGTIRIREVATTLFTALSKVITIVTAVGRVLFAVFGAIGSVIMGVLRIVGSILSPFAELLGIFVNSGGSAKSFADSVRDGTDSVVAFIDNGIAPLSKFLHGLSDAIKKVITTPLSNFFARMKGDTESMTDTGNGFIEFLGKIRDVVVNLWSKISPIFGKIGEALGKLGGLFRQLDFNAVFAGVNAGFLGAIAVSLVRLFNSGKGAVDAVSDILSFKESIIDVFDGITGTLKAMQNDLNASALIKLAAAIGILAVSMLILSTIDGASMASSSVGMAAMVSMLVGATVALDKFTTMKGAAKLPLIVGSLIALSVAILLMATALKVMSTMSWDDIGRGLTVLAATLLLMVGSMTALGNVGLKAAVAAGAMLVVSAAIMVLAVALKIMGTMSWDEIGRGLTVLAGAMIVMVGAMLILGKVGPQAVLAAAGMLVVSAAILVLAVSLKIMASMSWDEIGRGLTVLAAGMIVMVGALLLMSMVAPQAALASVALIVVASAIMILAISLKMLGSMSWSEIGVGLVAVTAGLMVMVGALLLLGLMGPMAILGAAALMIVAVAIGVLAASIMILGSMDMGSLIQGMIALTVALGIMVGAVLLLGVAGPLAIMGAAAILIMAGALAVITAVLVTLGSLPAEAISQGLGAISAALGILIGLGTALGVLSPILILGAVALTALGVALVIAGAGMLVMGIGIAIFSGAAPQAAAGLEALGTAIATAMIYLPSMIAMGAALIVFGAGAIVAGAGALVLGVGLMLLSAGLALIGVTAPMGSAGLMMLTSAMMAAAPATTSFIAVGAGLVVLGAGLLVFGAGALVAGAGLLVFGAAMALMSAVGKAGANTLGQVVEKIAGLTGQAVKLGIMSIALAALGVALLATGAGAMLSSVGLMATAMALMMLMATYKGAVNGLKAVSTAVMTMSATSGTLMSIAAAVLALGAGFTATASSGTRAASGILAMVASAMLGTNAVRMLAMTVTSMIPAAVVVFGLLGPAVARAAVMVVAGMSLINKGISSAVGPSIASASMLAAGVAAALIGGLSASVGSVHAMAFAVGMAVAQGMTRGIQSGSYIVTAAADQVAAEALAASKARLGVKSPSREYKKIGVWSDKGLAIGFRSASGLVATAASDVAEGSLLSMQKAFKKVNEVVLEDLDLSPTIRPILDLTEVEKNASRLQTLTDIPTLDTGRLYADTARVTAQLRETEEQGRVDNERAAESSPTLNYTQNNYSPKALSATEIYRKTKSQVATVKEALKDDNRGTRT